jgi:predicted S18 family serine protease
MRTQREHKEINPIPEAVMSAAQRIEEPEAEIDKAQLVLDAFAGNALAALRSVIADAEHLCVELETASLYLSTGIARGWKPTFEREG